MYELETCMMSIPIYMERMLNYIQPNYHPLVDIFLFTKGINRCRYASVDQDIKFYISLSNEGTFVWVLTFM